MCWPLTEPGLGNSALDLFIIMISSPLFSSLTNYLFSFLVVFCFAFCLTLCCFISSTSQTLSCAIVAGHSVEVTPNLFIMNI